MRRIAWFCLGWLAVALGVIGVVLPGLPSVGCFVGAAACFSKSHPRFEQWILDLPTIGPMVRDHRAGLGMPRKAKVIAITTMSIACLVSTVIVGSIPVGIAILATGAVGLWYIAFRVPTRTDATVTAVAPDPEPDPEREPEHQVS